jgi:ketosteroid isomerase-like protein
MTSNFISIATLYLTTVFCGCFVNGQAQDVKVLKEEILKTEKEFNEAAKTKGIAEAFYYYADENAVIKRQNDTLIRGKESIKQYYQNPKYRNTEVTWSPDFVDVSSDGTMGYTYGKFTWKMKDEKGKTTTYTGIFHTVWKRQGNGLWRYVWD